MRSLRATASTPTGWPSLPRWSRSTGPRSTRGRPSVGRAEVVAASLRCEVSSDRPARRLSSSRACVLPPAPPHRAPRADVRGAAIVACGRVVPTGGAARRARSSPTASRCVHPEVQSDHPDGVFATTAPASARAAPTTRPSLQATDGHADDARPTWLGWLIRHGDGAPASTARAARLAPESESRGSARCGYRPQYRPMERPVALHGGHRTWTVCEHRRPGPGGTCGHAGGVNPSRIVANAGAVPGHARRAARGADARRWWPRGAP